MSSSPTTPYRSCTATSDQLSPISEALQNEVTTLKAISTRIEEASLSTFGSSISQIPTTSTLNPLRKAYNLSLQQIETATARLAQRRLEKQLAAEMSPTSCGGSDSLTPVKTKEPIVYKDESSESDSEEIDNFDEDPNYDPQTYTFETLNLGKGGNKGEPLLPKHRVTDIEKDASFDGNVARREQPPRAAKTMKK